MFCRFCGAQISDNAVFCKNCGNAIQNSATSKAKMSRSEYINKYLPEFKYTLAWISILCYICAGINIFISIAITRLALIEVVLLVGLTLGMQLGKSRACAIALLSIGLIAFSSNTATATLWLVSGIWAVIAFRKMNKNYKMFLSNEFFSEIKDLKMRKKKSKKIWGTILLVLGGISVASLIKFTLQGNYQNGVDVDDVRQLCLVISMFYGGFALLFFDKTRFRINR